MFDRTVTAKLYTRTFIILASVRFPFIDMRFVLLALAAAIINGGGDGA